MLLHRNFHNGMIRNGEEVVSVIVYTTTVHRRDDWVLKALAIKKSTWFHYQRGNSNRIYWFFSIHCSFESSFEQPKNILLHFSFSCTKRFFLQIEMQFPMESVIVQESFFLKRNIPFISLIKVSSIDALRWLKKIL